MPPAEFTLDAGAEDVAETVASNFGFRLFWPAAATERFEDTRRAEALRIRDRASHRTGGRWTGSLNEIRQVPVRK
jgi:hypothetical protein